MAQKPLVLGSVSYGYPTTVGGWSTTDVLFERSLYHEFCDHATDCAVYNWETMYCVDTDGNDVYLSCNTGGEHGYRELSALARTQA